MKLFSKNLTATDCLKRLAIPRRVLTSLPEFHGGHAVDLRVRCETMEYWPLVCTIRKKGRYKKPVISKGWRKFVLGNNLNVGDELSLYKEEDEEPASLHFRVEVKRATRPPRALLRSPPCLDLDVDEASGTSCIDQTSPGIRATDETNNTHFRQFRVNMSDVVEVNNVQENSRSQYSEEQERKFKLFGAIVGGGLLVGTSETIDHKAYRNSLKQSISLSASGAELVNSFRTESTAEEETAILHFNLGLTVGAAVVHVHDKAISSSTPFHKTDQRVGFELDMIAGQSIGDHRSAVNLDLTLVPPILFDGE